MVKVELNDSIFNDFLPWLKTDEAFVKKEKYEVSNSIKATYSVKILLSEEEEQFTRKVYTILDMLGEIGALSGALGIIVNYFLDFYNASMFEEALVKTLFKLTDLKPSD